MSCVFRILGKLYPVLMLINSQLAVSEDRQESKSIDALVVYTKAAKDWANGLDQGRGFDCEYLLSGHNTKIYLGNGNDIEVNASKQIKALKDHFKIDHPCYQDGFARSKDSIDNLIQIAVAELNQALLDTDAEALVRVVGTYEIKLTPEENPFSDGGDDSHYYEEFIHNEFNFYNKIVEEAAKSVTPVSPEIMNLRTLGVRDICTVKPCSKEESRKLKNDLALDTVHLERLKHKADVVIMIAQSPREAFRSQYNLDDEEQKSKWNSYTGIGEAPATGVHTTGNAFIWVSAQHATAPTYTLTHEMGHILGANHYELSRFPVLGQIQPNAVEPDFPKESSTDVDNFGFIGQLDDGIFYGTVMSETTWCSDYIESIGGGKREKDIACSEGHATFRDFLVVPRFSNPNKYGMGTVTRNNARVVANGSKRFVALSGELLTACADHLSSPKIGFDFGLSKDLSFVATTPDHVLSNINTFSSEKGKDKLESWFNVTSTRRGAMPIEPGSPWQLEINNKFFGQGSNHITVSTMLATAIQEMPSSALNDGFSVVPGLFDAKNKPSMTLSGLNPDKTYSIKLFSSGVTLKDYRKIRVFVNGSKTSTAEQYTTGNISRYLDLHNLSPNEKGNIYLEFSSESGKTVLLNAIQIFEENSEHLTKCQLLQDSH